MRNDTGWALFLVMGIMLGMLLGHIATIAATQKDCVKMGASRIGGMTITCQVEGS